MESAKEKLRQLEEELNNDDSTSCTSSLATTVSDENDELNLGAEANSFDPSFLRNRGTFLHDQHDRPHRYSNRAMVIMKEIYTSVESCDTAKTYSSISSVSDLLDARSGNAEEVLYNLGFSARNESHTRSEILSRFKAPPIGLYKSPKVAPYNEEISLTNDANLQHYSESITKTKEWLAFQQDSNANGYDYNRKSSNGGEQSSLVTSLTAGKRVARNPKLRRKFSKSRQSSFDLLPDLKEEDATSEVEGQTKRTEEEGSSAFAPIRESSTELRTPTDQKVQPFSNDAISNVSEINSDKSDNAFIEDDSLKDPLQNKRPTLINSQLESFELEEIISNEGVSEQYNRSHNGGSPYRSSRRIGVVALPVGQRNDLISHNSEKTLRKNESSVRGSSGYETPPSDVGSDDNESSSGFGEEDLGHQDAVLQHQDTVVSRQDTVEELTPRADNNFSTKIIPKSVTESVKSECECGNHFGESPSVSTRFEFDVQLGTGHVMQDAVNDVTLPGTVKNDDVSNFANGNCNSNKRFDFKAISLDTALSNPLYGSMTSLSFDVTSQPKNTRYILTHRSPTSGKCRVASKNRQRRRELACESALTGAQNDVTMTSLVRDNDGHVAKEKKNPVTRKNLLFRSESAPVFLERVKELASSTVRKLEDLKHLKSNGNEKKAEINGINIGQNNNKCTVAQELYTANNHCINIDKKLLDLKNHNNHALLIEDKRRDDNNNSNLNERNSNRRGKLVRQRPTTSINENTS